MLIRSVGSLVMVWNGAETPLDDEWAEMIAALRAQDLNALRVLAFTEGGAQSPAQHLQLARLLAGAQMRAAVVSDAVGIRFVVSSVALFLKRIRTFRQEELDRACAYLELTKAEREAVVVFESELCASGRTSA